MSLFSVVHGGNETTGWQFGFFAKSSAMGLDCWGCVAFSVTELSAEYA